MSGIAVWRAAWWLHLSYSLVVFSLWGWRYSDRVQFNRSYESAFLYLSEWLSYANFQRVVDIAFFILTGFYLLVGIFIYMRKSRESIGILTSLSLMGVGNWFFLTLGTSWYLVIENLMLLLWVYAFTQLLFIFPNERAIPAGAKKLTGILFLIFLVSWPLAMLNENVLAIPLIGTGLLNIAGILSQVYRYFRLSTISEQQQTKWVFFSLLFLVFWGLFTNFDPGGSLRFEARAVYGLFLVATGFVVALMVPVAFTFSILRYRLFDIDLVIRRTLQYGLLTGLLLGLYFGTVVGLQTAFRALSGEESAPLITVVSTLLIAALFNPLRLRVQDLINRRFYRAAYDAEKILQKFSRSARDEVDIDRLGKSILLAVEEAMQPENAILWVKNQK